MFAECKHNRSITRRAKVEGSLKAAQTRAGAREVTYNHTLKQRDKTNSATPARPVKSCFTIHEPMRRGKATKPSAK
jgi:hypothetical protein